MNHYTVEYRNRGGWDRVNFVTYRDALAHATELVSAETCPVRIWKSKVIYEIPNPYGHTWLSEDHIIRGEN